MSGFKLILALISIVASAHAFGEARVLGLSARGGHVAVTHIGVEQWRETDRVCIFQGSANVGCGTVNKVQAKGAVVKLDQPSYRIRVGDVARRSDAREPAYSKTVISDREDTLILERTQFSTRPRGVFNVTAGLAGGAAYRFPQVQLQMGVTRHFVLGIGPLLYSANTGDDTPTPTSRVQSAASPATTKKPELAGFGAMATVTGYLNDRYSGFFVSGGAGMAALTLKGNGADQSKAVPLFILTTGIRFAWQNALNVGISAGVTKAPAPSTTANTFADSSIGPLLLVDVGFNF